MLDELLTAAIKVSKVPSEAYNFTPPDDVVLSPGKIMPLRNIFSNQPYSAKEREKLERLKLEIQKSRLVLPASYDDAELLRIIHGSGYKTRKALKDLKDSIETTAKLVPSDYKLLFPKVYGILV